MHEVAAQPADRDHALRRGGARPDTVNERESEHSTTRPLATPR
jgi:hypothetical protein